MSNRSAVGVDVGGTKTLAVLASETGRVLDWAEFATDRYAPPDALLSKVAELARILMAKSAVHSVSVQAIGVGVPGLVAPNRRFIDSIILPNWVDVDVEGQLSDMLQRKVNVDNDATMAAFGEWYARKPELPRLETLLCLTLGTGVGGAVIVEGQPRRGHDGTAGQLGHLSVDLNGRVCQCGGRGCLNAYVSGTAIAERYHERLGYSKEGDDPDSILAGSVHINGRQVAEAASKGDLLATAILAETSSYLGAGLTSLVNIFNPDVIVLTGGVSLLGEQLLAPARTLVSQRAFPIPGQRAQIVVGRYGTNAGAVGAAIAALNI